jgi:peroxiredoxin
VCAIAALVAFTVWINWQAKALDRELGLGFRKLSLTGRAAPAFHLPALDGHTVSLSDFHGRKVAVIFWASWNSGSHPAMMSLSVFYRNTHPQNADFDMLAVSVGDDRKTVEEFVERNKVPFPVALDVSEATARAFDVRSIPTVAVIDGTGKVTWSFVGFNQRLIFDLGRELGVTNFRSLDFGGPSGGRGN